MKRKGNPHRCIRPILSVNARQINQQNAASNKGQRWTMEGFSRTLLYSAALAMAAVTFAGCKSGGTGGVNGDTTTQASDQNAQQYPAQDPASANIAPIS